MLKTEHRIKGYGPRTEDPRQRIHNRGPKTEDRRARTDEPGQTSQELARIEDQGARTGLRTADQGHQMKASLGWPTTFIR